MPVLATLITIHLLGNDQVSALMAPAELRERAEATLDDAALRERVLRIVEEYEKLTATYHGVADEVLDTYRTQTEAADQSADDLLAVLAPLEDRRRAVLERIVALRGELRAQLSEEQWSGLLG